MKINFKEGTTLKKAIEIGLKFSRMGFNAVVENGEIHLRHEL